MRAVQRNRSAERSAELIAAIVLFVDIRDFLAERRRIERLVTEHREEAAAPIIRAALGDDVHDAAVAAAVFGLEPLRDEVELLNRLERERLQQPTDGVVVVVATVDLVVHVAAVAAVDLRRELCALRRVGVEAEADTRNRRREVRELTSVERQRLDALNVDDAAHRGGARFNHRRLAGDRHRLLHAGDLERHVHVERLTDVEHDGLVLDLGEPCQVRGQIVCADGKGVQSVDPFRVRDGGSAEARLRVQGRDIHAWNRRALIVQDAAGDVTGRLLREHWRSGQPQRAQDDHRVDDPLHALFASEIKKQMNVRASSRRLVIQQVPNQNSRDESHQFDREMHRKRGVFFV